MKGFWLYHLFLFLFAFHTGYGQWYESFSDGDFTNGISWAGTNTAWLVVASSDAAAGAPGSNTLRLNTASGAGTQYLSTQVSGSWSTLQTWGFWVGRRSQAATAANMMFVWLYASEPDVTSVTVDGYRIRFGDDISTGDKVILESVTNGIATNILSSAPVSNGITDYGFLVRVTHDAAGEWSLYTSILPTTSGSGATASLQADAVNANVLQGTVTNSQILSFDNGYVAVEAVHSTTAAARTGAEFDQLMVSFAESAPLPVRFSGINAFLTSSGIRLEWDNLTESDILYYSVEKSQNGRAFIQLEQLPPLKNDGGRVHYSITDQQVTGGPLYYRIKAQETTGHLLYSTVIRIRGNGNEPFVIYPNPVENGSLLFSIKLLPPGKYAAVVYNYNGMVIQKTFINHTGSGLSRSITITGQPKGCYLLEIDGPVKFRKKFVVQ
jgi:hypothetical protein